MKVTMMWIKIQMMEDGVQVYEQIIIEQYKSQMPMLLLYYNVQNDQVNQI